MKVEFTDSFTKSLRKLVWHQHWIYKTYSLFRYDIPLFVKNVWRFRKELANHQWWDYRFNLEMLYRSLSITYEGMKNGGYEVRETREPKVKAMARALELLKHRLDDDYVDRAEAELGELIMHDWEFEDVDGGNYRLVDKETKKEKAHNRRVFKRALLIETQEWKELWSIIHGTKNSKIYGEGYDGSDLRSWWD
jgi:hypothetical protein